MLSSLSKPVLTLTALFRLKSKDDLLISTIHLLDLTGSERVKRATA